mmetsp:Transcript_109491/g.308916  ORF Transcript_109491/g.308916 Transcript_109491/m.308916 type:complete len:411 (-) Transcript_109491:62-1294(-)
MALLPLILVSSVAAAAAGADGDASGSQKSGTCKYSLNPRTILNVESDKPFPPSFGSCALIGSGGALKGKGLGPEIDSYDTVVRINRVPGKPFQADLGKKTDIYYSNTATDTYPAGETGEWVTVAVKHNPVGLKLWCQYGHKIMIKRMCPFASTILTRSTKWGTDKIMDFEIAKFFQTPFPVAHTSDVLELFFWNANAIGHYYTSGGLKAFFTVAPFCDTITLYGFSGSGNFDGHLIDSVHNFGNEHAWLHRLAEGDVRDEDFELRRADDFVKKDGYDEELLNRSVPFIDALKDYCSCMGKNHLIRFLPPDYQGAKKMAADVDDAVDAAIERVQWGSSAPTHVHDLEIVRSTSGLVFCFVAAGIAFAAGFMLRRTYSCRTVTAEIACGDEGTADSGLIERDAFVEESATAE